MKVLWLCNFPIQVQQAIFGDKDHGAQGEGSATLPHFPPPREIELHAACLWPGGTARNDFVYNSVNYHLLPCPIKGRASTFFMFDHLFYRKLFFELKPDIVHAWGSEDSMGLVAARLAPSRNLLSTQGFMSQIVPHSEKSIRSFITARMERKILVRVKYICAENEFAAKQVRLLSNREPVAIIDYPIRNEILTSSAASGQDKKAIFVGRITRAKGYEDCMIAFAKSMPLEWRLHMIGTGAPKAEAHLHTLSNELGIRDRFTHHRRLALPELISAMQRSSIFILPTYIEGGCIALKEALSLGLWPVCYDNSGPGIYIRKFNFGSLVKDRDICGLAEVLGTCAKEKPWLDQLRRNSVIDNVRQSLSRETIWENLMQLYARVTK